MKTGTVIPADAWLGIEAHRFSPGVREMCCREALHCSFEVAAENLQRTAQLSLSARSIRQLAENQGRAVLSAQRTGALQPGFTSADCTDETMITGADGDYKELKIVSFYDPDKSHCHVAGTAGDHEALGRLMRREAGRLRLAEARIKYGVSDGAPWIANQYARNLPMLDEHILDYYHLQEHVIATSHALYGEGTKKARDWCEELMGVVWEQGSLVLLHRLGPYLRRHRGGPKREALASLRDYVGKRVRMTDYPAFRALGYDCGSGPTESQCGTLTGRVKGQGMRWDTDNAEALMALASIYHSGLWWTYWKLERTAA